MNKAEETRLQNLISKSQAQKLNSLENTFLKNLKEKKKRELSRGPEETKEPRDG